MNTPVTEAELKERSAAPRVTQEDFDANIVSIHYINAGEAIEQCSKVGGPVANESEFLLTLCIITLKNGFTVVGESACASRDNYKQDIGERLALEKAKEKIWPLMGYALRETLNYD